MFIMESFTNPQPLTFREKVFTGLTIGVGIVSLITAIGLYLSGNGVEAVNAMGEMGIVFAYAQLTTGVVALTVGLVMIGLETRSRFLQKESSRSSTTAESNREPPSSAKESAENSSSSLDASEVWSLFDQLSILEASESLPQLPNNGFSMTKGSMETWYTLLYAKDGAVHKFPSEMRILPYDGGFTLLLDGTMFGGTDGYLGGFEHAVVRTLTCNGVTAISNSTKDFRKVLDAVMQYAGLDHLLLTQKSGDPIRYPSSN